jgi:hypothetical protein
MVPGEETGERTKEIATSGAGGWSCCDDLIRNAHCRICFAACAVRRALKIDRISDTPSSKTEKV